MKPKSLTSFLILLLILFAGLSARPQCLPENPTQCPDPENNGQICPDSLTTAHVSVQYTEVVTIKPPSTFLYDSLEITIDHVQLMSVGNVPEGINWVTNAENDIFEGGQYYCVRMEGTPVAAGDYPLHIVVDVYAVVLPGFPAIKVATVTDSTSLTMVVANDAGITEDNKSLLHIRQNIPNPFQSFTRINFSSGISGRVDFEVYSILGQKVSSSRLDVTKGDNSIVYNGSELPEGPYFYIFRAAGMKSTGIMIRKN